MVEQAEAQVATAAAAVPVDPFDFFPGIASKIRGLGGNAPGHDPYYVFHTSYHEAAPGPSRFVVQFHGLRARRGTLWLRVHMLPMEHGARAVMANSERIQLNRLIQNGQRVEIRFEGFRGMSFALWAGIQDDTDAEADGLEVLFDRPFDPADVPGVVADVRNTAFGRDVVTAVPHMLAAGRPGFADPVSQIATRGQLREPSYRAAAADLGLPGETGAEWAQAFVLQALRRYGMVQAGAHGVGFDVGASALPDALAGAGLSVLATEPTEAVAAASPALPRRYAPLDAIPGDLINFDFAWSVGAWDRLESAAAALRFVEGVLATLRPGGLAVHAGAYRLRGRHSGAGARLAREDIERLLLVLISRGHVVAQFKYNERDALIDPATGDGAVGIIVRKASSVL